MRLESITPKESRFRQRLFLWTGAMQVIEGVEEPARKAFEAEQRTTVTAEPLDIAAFRKKQATFRAHRLSPETSEKFFRQAVPFVGGALEEFHVSTRDGPQRPAFKVTLPPNLRQGRGRELLVSFWPEVCTDDETEENAILFIAPGHWLFETLVDRVIKACTPDVGQGAVFFDLQPEDESPHLVWFVRSQVRDEDCDGIRSQTGLLPSGRAQGSFVGHRV